jgi:Uma2 family endonuclease
MVANPGYDAPMNAPHRHDSRVLPRRLFTVSDLDRMTEAGILGADEHVELWQGELVPMAAKSNAHEAMVMELNLHFGANRPKDVLFKPEAGWRIAKDLYLEPDFLFFPADIPYAEVTPADALLVIEISVSTLRRDLNLKSKLYAELGIREVWVIDLNRHRTHVLSEPGSQDFLMKEVVAWDEPLAASLAPAITLRLADLPKR